MNHLYNLIPSITSIELNIKTNTENRYSPKNTSDKKKYNIKNAFWVPRILNHAFNILITDKKVIISQSWFNAMNYKSIYTLSHAQFIKWLDKFRKLIQNYKNKPMQVFQLFKFPKSKINQDIKNMFKYAKDSNTMIISFTANYSYFNKNCE
jgi:hypothetical protein